jgi:hypothetical protein
MQKLADIALRAGGWMLCWSLVAMFVAGVQSFFDVAFAPALFLMGAMALILSMGLLIGGFCLDQQLEEWTFEQRRRAPSPKIALDPRPKPDGYNDAVIGWFHRGPELRQRDEEFHRGFAVRSAVPPPRKKP